LSDSRLIIALDFSDIDLARQLVEKLTPADCRLKIGKQMFTLFGPEFVKECVERGFDVFLDLKFHDIPNTVSSAILAACELGVWMVNVHVQGGVAMLKAARAAVDSFSGSKPLLIGVTLLTSLDANDLSLLGQTSDIKSLVLDYAQLAHAQGLDGVVCSAQEAVYLRQHLPHSFLLVTPGIALEGDPSHDQKRVLTPQQALSVGADYLVIGRSITQAENPLQRLRQCLLSCQ
jgi:orotidine-5'-phosphate decarboxylase